MASKPGQKKTTAPRSPQASAGNREGKFTFRVPSWAIFAVLCLTALIYIRAFNNFFTNFDDDFYILYNPYLRNFSFDGVISIFSSFYNYNYHPLTTLTYLFEYQIYGLNPLPYHVFNVLLHLINTYLVYKLAEKLSGNNFTALFVSLLFAVHPMHVESVAWVSERKDVLYALFYISALITYLKYLKSGYNLKYFIVCLAFFILSLLSKPAAVTLPVLMLAVDFYKKRKPGTRMFLEKTPFLALSVLFGILVIMAQQSIMRDVSIYSFSFMDKIFLFTYTITFYVIKLVVPFQLSAWHYYPDVNGGPLPWTYYASLPFVALLVWLTVRRTTFLREKIFGVCFFLIVISVMLQIIGVGVAITAERYTYLSYIGVLYIAGQWISTIQKPALRKPVLIIIALAVLAFSYLSWDRIRVWKDGNSLFTDVIKKYPDSFHAYCIRGKFKYEYAKDYQGALQDFNRSLEMYPTYYECLISRGALLINEIKDYSTALHDWNLAIQLNPAVAKSYNYRGIAYANLNDLESALKDFNTTLQMDTVNAEAYNNRGMVYDRMNDTAAALRDFNKATMINPGLGNAYYNKGMLKARTGNLAGAITDISIAISIKADDDLAYRNRAAIKFMMKDYSGSLEDCNNALKINPKDGIALFNRGQTRLNLNDTAGACNDWNQAFSLGYTDAGDALTRFCR